MVPSNSFYQSFDHGNNIFIYFIGVFLFRIFAKLWPESYTIKVGSIHMTSGVKKGINGYTTVLTDL